MQAGTRAFPKLTRHAAGSALAMTFATLSIIYAAEHYVIGRGIESYAVAAAETEPVTVPAVIPPPQPAQRREPQPTAAPVREANAAPPKPVSRKEMVLRLQAGLRQAGCYHGSVNGSWNAATQRAMLEFSSATNSRLPVSQPSEVLLALIDANGDAHCGVDPVVAEADPVATSSLQAAPTMSSAAAPEKADPVAALIAANAPGAANAAGPAIDPATGSAVAAAGTAATVSKTALAANTDPTLTMPPAGEAEPAAKPRKSASNAARTDRPKKRRTSTSSNSPSKIAKSFFKGIQKAFSGF